MKQILSALKEVFLSYYPDRSLLEAMMKYDFKIGDAKTNLMQLCFSNLASWPLIFILTVIYFDPFKTSWSMVKLLSFDNSLVLFLLDGRILNMLFFFLLFYIFEWIFRKEYILIALIFYFLNRSELHVHLAVVGTLAVYLSRISYLWWLSVDCESETQKIWKAVSVLQFVAWIVTAVTVISALDYIQTNYLFNEATDLTRFNFLCLTVLLYHIFSHLFLSLWGHFYVQKTIEPSHLPVYFSTSSWILRFNMSYYLQSLLKAKTTEQLEKHQQNEIALQEMGNLSHSLGSVLRKEISYLKEAHLRLGKI